MDLENYILKMMIFCKVCLYMEDVKVKEDLLNLMVAIMMGILRIMLLMVMEVILVGKDLDIKGNGKIMYLMDLAKLYIQMEPDMWDNFLTIKNMVKVHYINAIIFIVGNLKMITLMENLNIKVRMDKLMMEDGNKVRNMVLEYTLGLMEVYMRDSMLMEKEKVKVK